MVPAVIISLMFCADRAGSLLIIINYCRSLAVAAVLVEGELAHLSVEPALIGHDRARPRLAGLKAAEPTGREGGVIGANRPAPMTPNAQFR